MENLEFINLKNNYINVPTNGGSLIKIKAYKKVRIYDVDLFVTKSFFNLDLSTLKSIEMYTLTCCVTGRRISQLKASTQKELMMMLLNKNLKKLSLKIKERINFFTKNDK